jgi:hypothetical protein
MPADGIGERRFGGTKIVESGPKPPAMEVRYSARKRPASPQMTLPMFAIAQKQKGKALEGAANFTSQTSGATAAITDIQSLGQRISRRV